MSALFKIIVVITEVWERYKEGLAILMLFFGSALLTAVLIWAIWLVT